MGTPGSPSQPAYLAIVDRGKPGLLQSLKAQLEEPGLVEVVWDRRLSSRRRGDRAVAGGPRRGDRRGEPPLTWATLGFVLVPQRAPLST